MKIIFAITIAVLMTSNVAECAQAAASNTCKQCSDFRKRCMANYPGPTCKTDYDICIKACRKS